MSPEMTRPGERKQRSAAHRACNGGVRVGRTQWLGLISPVSWSPESQLMGAWGVLPACESPACRKPPVLHPSLARMGQGPWRSRAERGQGRAHRARCPEALPEPGMGHVSERSSNLLSPVGRQLVK